MKKIFAVLLVAFLFLAPIASAESLVVSSGLSTSDRLICTGHCVFYGAQIISSTSTNNIVIYDSTTITSGSEILKASASSAVGWPGSSYFLTFPIECFTGIYADITGTGAAYIIYYRAE